MSLLAHNYIPSLKFGAKILPQEILGGGLGLPYVGNIYWVDPNSGSDSNPGDSQAKAKKTVAAAYALTTNGNHDVVLISPSGGTGRTTETTAITWSNKFTHLIGNAAPIVQDARAGMNFSGTGGTATGSLSITGTGCIFANLTMTTTDDNNSFVSMTGDYNAFIGVDFKGALNATTGADTAARALVLTGAQENYFSNCTFGADTYTRSAANATLEFASASSRNVFEDCRFTAFISAATPVHVKFTGTSAIDRWIEFKNCTFSSMSANDATAQTACMDLSSQTTTGHVLVTGAPFLDLGITDWEATASGRIIMQAYTATANILGLAVKPTVS